MNTKQQLAQLLEENADQFISGSVIAEKLGITRAAVWKNIQALEEEGYQIDAVKNRGYRLGEKNDVVSPNCIRKYLGDYADIFDVEVYSEITSTNDVLKERADSLPDWHTIISGHQTKGKGRRSRSFYSPEDTGVYLSILLRLSLAAEEATRITTAAAVAVCRAIEECTTEKPAIKWVNDVFVNGKKICGILTEASISMESGGLSWAVLGVGLNIYEPEGGFPDELKNIAGGIVKERQQDLRSRMAAAFMKQFYLICRNLLSEKVVEEYKERSFLIGQQVNVLKQEMEIPAQVLDIDRNCALIVRYQDGRQEALSSGEVSIRVCS